MTLPFHPLANLFPLIEGQEFEDLVASIRANGLRDPIITYDGLVLDGRNRARACDAAEVACIYEGLHAGVDPLQFVIDKNLKRRHLDESQRAYIAAKIANLGHGGARSPCEPSFEWTSANLPLENETPPITQKQAAAMLNVSERSVRDAKAVQERGTPELQRAVEQGSLPVSAGAQAVKLDPDKQRKVAEEARAGHAKAARNVLKQETRTAREADLSAMQRALPDKKYCVILADPEWRFEVYSRDTGMDRAADNHYPTSATDAICARPVGDIAADDCALFLWATAPMLPDALKVMEAWGFEYKSHCIWDKRIAGTGYWFRNRHELLLVGTKGKIPAPAMGDQEHSVIAGTKRAHSAKPDIFVQLIESYFPTLPKIELNRRGPAREGWDAWGNESESESPTPAMASRREVEPTVISEPDRPILDEVDVGSTK